MTSRLNFYLKNTPQEKQNKAVIAYLANFDHLEEFSPEIAEPLLNELKTQRSHIKLIASENYSSLSVQLAMANLLTDKYAEGYPDHRFYAGCENVDTIEALAEERAKTLFNAEAAYVQPHSGADANLVALWAIITERVQNKELEKLHQKNISSLTEKEHETVRQILINQKLLGMSLGSGGHLTHGYRHNISSKFLQASHYDVDKETGLVNYKTLREQAKAVKPLILMAGYSAYPRRLNFAIMKEIAEEVGAVLFVDMAHFAGLVAGGVFQGDENPVPFADIVTSTTHKTLRGPRGGLILCKKEFDEVVHKGCPLVLGGPLGHVIAAKAIAFKEAQADSFKTYAHRIVLNAKRLSQSLLEKGCTLLTGGTDNHLVLIDAMKSYGLTGRQAETHLFNAGITLNRNAIPFDSNGAWYTSGLRLGTAAVTTLGMQEEDMDKIAEMIDCLLKDATAATTKEGVKSLAKVTSTQKTVDGIKEDVKNLLSKYPLYPEVISIENNPH
jgi:glycine hydroxymethyltransferase